MGLGPSIKMTTLHHYNCPVVAELSKHQDIEFSGIIVGGVSENYDAKVFTAKRIGDIAKILGIDGAIVAIDGWGNHHIDFVNAIEELGKNNIISVGLSFVGRQGRLVCTNEYVETIVDFNKGVSGYESCVVGGNNLTEYDAKKAVAILKNKIKKKGLFKISDDNEVIVGKLTKKIFSIKEVVFGEETKIIGGKLYLARNIEEKYNFQFGRIKNIKINIISPNEKDIFVNSNLDFMPIACKIRGELGNGETCELEGVKVMLTGIEESSQFQPANIGSSEGILQKIVKFDEAGTPRMTDYIIHVDVLFKEGEGRTSEGVIQAHAVADYVLEEIRQKLRLVRDMVFKKEEYYDVKRPGKTKIILVKLVSVLGNMYDTLIFPHQPCGVLGAYNLRECKNLPIVITPNQLRDGVIHSLL